MLFFFCILKPKVKHKEDTCSSRRERTVELVVPHVVIQKHPVLPFTCFTLFLYNACFRA